MTQVNDQITQFISADIKPELQRQIYMMTIGIDALDCISKIVPDAMDNDLIEGEQLGHLLKCIEYSLLNTQRKLIRAIEISK